MLQIGEVAERVGLSLRTLRHWDDRGLLVPSARSAGGFRLYTDDDVERCRFIMSLRPLGLSLDELREFADAVDTARGGSALEPAVRDRLEQFRSLTRTQTSAVRRQLQELGALGHELDSLLDPPG